MLAREYGQAAAEGLVRYALLTGCGEYAQGVMADWWDQPASHLGVALGTTVGGQLPTLEAMGLHLDGVDEPTAKLLRDNAERIALNYGVLADRLALTAVPATDRTQVLNAVRIALDRLEALGADKGYLKGWRKWLADAGRG